MSNSFGWRFFVVGILILMMFIPLFFVGEIVDDRSHYNRTTRSSVGMEWGGPQILSGPVLVIPVEESTLVKERRELFDPETGMQRLDTEGKPVFRIVEEVRQVQRSPLFIYPNLFEVELTSETEARQRGIFTVPVYSSTAEFNFDFPLDTVATFLGSEETPLWNQAELHLSVTSNRSLRGKASLNAGDVSFELEPLQHRRGEDGGVMALTGDPRAHETYQMTFEFNGAESLMIAPVGRNSRIRMVSDWPHPSFTGAFLPTTREISDEGFTADWLIPHLARALPQISRESYDSVARRQTSFGVNLYQPNDLYQKSYRAARYGILFIGLTFLTIFLIKSQGARPTHPVQFILVGLSQSTFFLLLLAFAEQIGFGAAYLVASSATVLLIVAFGAAALRLGKRTLALALMLTLLYGVLYLILRSADYALLAGSILTFIAIAATMYATRNENWYEPQGEGSGRRGWFKSKAITPNPPAE